MTKFAKLNYSELETKKINNFESSFTLQPLERGFGNTLGNAVRRTLLSSISGVAPFAMKATNVDHEFQTISGVTEDAVQLVLNLKDVRFVFNREIFKEGEVVKVTLKAKKGEVFAKDFTLPAGVEIVNPDAYIATTSKNDALELEMFLTAGRGFLSFEENKNTVKELMPQIDSKLKSGTIIAMDSDFSPVVNVSYESVELNSSAIIIEEKLTINVKTDGSVEAKDAIAEAAHILTSHLQVLSDVSNINQEVIFDEFAKSDSKKSTKTISISMLDLSVRSYNCLKRAGFETLEDLSKLTLKELTVIKNLGKKSVEEIINKLEEHEITLEEGE